MRITVTIPEIELDSALEAQLRQRAKLAGVRPEDILEDEPHLWTQLVEDGLPTIIVDVL